MSGGRFDYFYFKIGDQLGTNLGTLREIIQMMEESPDRFNPEATKVLKEYERRVEALVKDSENLSELLHDIEWVGSGDYGPDAIDKELEALKKNSDWWNGFNQNRNPQGVG